MPGINLRATRSVAWICRSPVVHGQLQLVPVVEAGNRDKLGTSVSVRFPRLDYLAGHWVQLAAGLADT
jgi:hypothetical protein